MTRPLRRDLPLQGAARRDETLPMSIIATAFALFGVLIALAILRAVIGRSLNPLREVEASELPPTIRREVQRIVPDFEAQTIRLSKNGRQARLRGQRAGMDCHLKVDLDRDGGIDEIEFDTRREGSVRRSPIDPAELPEAVSREFDRLLGALRNQLSRPRLAAGTLDGVGNYELKGRAEGYDWEIEVDESGRLLEFEMEREGR